MNFSVILPFMLCAYELTHIFYVKKEVTFMLKCGATAYKI
jgi:hypothetical protein